MSNEVEFLDTDGQGHQFKSRAILGEPAVPKMVSKLVSFGVAKDSDTAVKILIGAVIMCFILTVLVIFFASSRSGDGEDENNMQPNLYLNTSFKPK